VLFGNPNSLTWIRHFFKCTVSISLVLFLDVQISSPQFTTVCSLFWCYVYIHITRNNIHEFFQAWGSLCESVPLHKGGSTNFTSHHCTHASQKPRGKMKVMKHKANTEDTFFRYLNLQSFKVWTNWHHRLCQTTFQLLNLLNLDIWQMKMSPSVL